MKKTLLLAALMAAAFAVPAMPAVAADAIAKKPSIEAKCFFLPLLPACVEEITAEAGLHGWSLTTIPVDWWTCKKAEAKAGHLLDCTTA